MSEASNTTDLQERTRQLLQGSLKHVRAAGLAAALLPLGAIPAAANPEQSCPSAGICGYVWNDVNGNGVQDPDEPPIEGAVVTVTNEFGDQEIVATNQDGFYEAGLIGSEQYTVSVQIPPGSQPSPTDAGGDDTIDSDGTPDGMGNSTVTLTPTGVPTSNVDFGFTSTPTEQPGTGTPGYWKNHPEAWPVESITVGGEVYTKAEAINILSTAGKDRRLTMFSSLVPAMLNVLIGNDESCVQSTIDAANAWMALYGRVGTGTIVQASSAAWKIGEPLHRHMDNYNNGMFCAPARD